MNKRRARKTTTRRRRTTRKGMLTLKRQKAYQPKRRKSTMARRTRRTSRTRSVTKGISNVFNRGTLGKVAVGVGAAAIVGTIMDRFLPASPVTALAKPIAAYSAGGAAGAIGSVLLEGGLGSIGQFFGMQSQSTNQTSSGGFSV